MSKIATGSRSVRFRAVIEQQGINPYVDVPARVSKAFAAYADAGRIAVDGTLNGVSIRATLVPVRGGHRLYVNGGMRSAANVAVGDTVSFDLRAHRPGKVVIPDDVAAALRRVKGASPAFAALEPSHRREMVRYVDDARTDMGRRKRIQKLVEYALGGAESAKPSGPARPLWTCPICGNEFVNRNQIHACARRDVAEVFEGKPAHIRALFERFRELVEACGPVRMVVYREKVGFMVRVRFAGAVPRRKWLEVGFWLRRRVESQRMHKIETIYPNAHVHLLRITESDQLDAELATWLAEAYVVGCQGATTSLVSDSTSATRTSRA